MTFEEQLHSQFGDRLKKDEPLKKHTNFRLGGAARWFVEARTIDEMKAVVLLANETQTPLFILGGGSNTLALDEGYPGIVLAIGLRTFQMKGNEVYAEAGVMSAALARATAEAGLQGFAWAISLPGTIGGAVRGNAGCFGGEMSDVVKSAQILRDGQIVTLTKNDLQFSYRDSVIKHSSDIVLSVILELIPGNVDTLKEQLATTLGKRKTSQPLYAGSAGCIFKNYNVASDEEMQRIQKKLDLSPEMIQRRRLPAGWIIDQLGLKGTKIGGAEVSQEHGNFIVNKNQATASDVVQLISLIKRKVRDELGVQLEEEVQYLT